MFIVLYSLVTVDDGLTIAGPGNEDTQIADHGQIVGPGNLVHIGDGRQFHPSGQDALQ